MPMPSPHVAIQPVCTDRLTISRERVQRLIDLADSTALEAEDRLDRYVEGDGWDRTSEDLAAADGYARGARDALRYLLDPDSPPTALSELLEV